MPSLYDYSVEQSQLLKIISKETGLDVSNWEVRFVKINAGCSYGDYRCDLEYNGVVVNLTTNYISKDIVMKGLYSQNILKSVCKLKRKMNEKQH